MRLDINVYLLYKSAKEPNGIGHEILKYSWEWEKFTDRVSLESVYVSM